MLRLVQAWLGAQHKYYVRKENVLDKARNRLATRRDVPVQGLPESPMTAAQLRDQTRPLEMDPVIDQGRFRGEEACALWLANWLAAWESQDKQLSNQVIDQTRARVTA
jgi:hypothetical protein